MRIPPADRPKTDKRPCVLQDGDFIDDGVESTFGRPEDAPYAEAPEPPLTVAVLAGGPGNYAQRAASLASARNLLEQLQTAPYDIDRPSLGAMIARANAFLSEKVAGPTSSASEAVVAEPQADAAAQGAPSKGPEGVDGDAGGRTVESLPQHLRTGGIHVLT